MSTVVEARSIANGQRLFWWLNTLLDLIKIKISLLVTLTAAAGYLLAAGRITMQMAMVTASIFILACGSCALNQYQEREIDGLMERTKSRPIPSGKLNPDVALRISTGLILFGSLILLYGVKHLVSALGLFAVFWYNLFYTPLKHKTAFAVVPGALIGAIPPILGWASAGGTIFDPRIWGVASFFFIWQIPHFWLLLLDYSGDYEKAELPSITQLFSMRQIKRIIFIWLLSAGVSGLSTPLFNLIHSHYVYLGLVAATFWLFQSAVIFLRTDSGKTSIKVTFTKLNVYALLVLFLLSVDRLLS